MPYDHTPIIERQAWVDGGDGLEKRELDLGYIPLTDCAPLVIAHEKGFFERHGLRVTLHREASWASIRDKTIYGVFDAAHMLYPMPLALTLGVGGPSEPMATALCLNLGGNAITVSNGLYEQMKSASSGPVDGRLASAEALRRVVQQRERDCNIPLTFGVVFPTSTHHYELRYWMAAAGIDPDRDVRIIVVPPPEMPQWLRSGRIDGYCVGEPWNALAVQRGWGRTLVTKHELWNNAPEKVLGVTAKWAARFPRTHLALVRALVEAGAWLDQRGNREETARLLAQPHYVDAPFEVVRSSLLGSFVYEQAGEPVSMPDFMVFHRHAANFPWRSHAIWFLTQMARWGQIDKPIDYSRVAARVVLPGLYRQAAAELGVAAPTVDVKPEGLHPRGWTLTNATSPITMGPDLLVDRCVFDPAEPEEYLRRLAQAPRPSADPGLLSHIPPA